MRSKGAVALAVALIAVVLGLRSFAHSTSEPTFYLCAAMKKAWEPIIQQFEKEYHVHINVIYGSSGGLLSQLTLSKVGDVYSSATPPYMEKAIREGIVDPKSVRVVACLAPAILYKKGNYIYILCLMPKSCFVIGQFAMLYIASSMFSCAGHYQNFLKTCCLMQEIMSAAD